MAFFDVVVSCVEEAISGVDGGQVGAGEEAQSLVVLYQALFIIDTFVQASSTAASFFNKHFTEEFKYYINVSKAEQNLPTQHLLAQDALELLSRCKSKIK